MNERIRQLREQAWTLVSNEERDRGELYEAREQWERCDQKFAELIVQECMEQVWYTREDGINGNISEVIKQRIKQHFGVEL
jgi:hypothetical protein